MMDNGTFALDASWSDVTDQLLQNITTAKESMQNFQTGKLWLQYMEMVDILRKLLKGERTGNWKLHMQAMYDLLPYLAASGHNLYTKSVYIIYVQQMAKLED